MEFFLLTQWKSWKIYFNNGKGGENGMYSRLVDFFYERRDIIRKIGIVLLVVILMGSGALLLKQVFRGIEKSNQAHEEWVIKDKTVGKVEKTYIVGIKRESETKGKAVSLFYYGFGSLSSTDYYVVYAVQEDGGLLLTKYRCDEVPLYPVLSDDEKPYYEVTYAETGRLMSKKLYIPEDSMQVEYKIE